MNRQLVLGDPHGGLRGLLQVFERAKLDYDNDVVICVGDVVDGWPDTKGCVDLLRKIKGLILVMGNHDYWALSWMKDHSYTDSLWTSQGGQATIDSYSKYNADGMYISVPQEHIDFFEEAHGYYIDAENRLFVHGGIEPGKKIERHDLHDLMWDRQLIKTALAKNFIKKNLTEYKEIFIGHTTTLYYKTDYPIHACEVWDIDTGGGWGGKITLMDVNTHEYWQSDFLKELYPDHRGR